ncbi:MAG: ribosome silencing factor [Muribaculaceae bacterium]|nr:ribosome silencing factor [Muribaculaceae bacterium]
MIEDKILIDTIIKGIQEKKGISITHVDLHSLAVSSAEDFVICTGRSTSQVSAIADGVREYVQDNTGVKPYNYDGYQNSQWIVIDYGTIYVHIFLPDARQYYNLEELWNDASLRSIPDID